MGRGHAVHEQQVILSTTVVISHTFYIAKKKRADPQKGVAVNVNHPIVQIGH